MKNGKNAPGLGRTFTLSMYTGLLDVPPMPNVVLNKGDKAVEDRLLVLEYRFTQTDPSADVSQ